MCCLVLLLLVKHLTSVLFGVSMIMLSISGLIALVLSVIFMLCLFQPYKKTIHTIIDILFLAVFAILISCDWIISDHTSVLREYIDRIVVFIFIVIPLVYPLLSLYYICRRSGLLQTFRARLGSVLKNCHFSRVHVPPQVTVSEITNLIKH